MVCSSRGCELPRERADAELGAQLNAALVGVGERGRQPAGARLLPGCMRSPHLADGVTRQQQAALHGNGKQFRAVSFGGQPHCDRKGAARARRVVAGNHDPREHPDSVSPGGWCWRMPALRRSAERMGALAGDRLAWQGTTEAEGPATGIAARSANGPYLTEVGDERAHNWRDADPGGA